MSDFLALGFFPLGQPEGQLDKWPVASQASSGQGARTLIFAKEHLGGDEVQEFFFCGVP